MLQDISVGEAERVHRSAILIDDVCPLVQTRKYLDWCAEGGFTATAPTVAIYENAWQAIMELGAWHDHVRRHPELLIVRKAADIERAKSEGLLGLILHFQNTDPVENDLNLVDAYKALGVGVMQLCYNVRNRNGTGATEQRDDGLSRFGEKFVDRCNKVAWWSTARTLAGRPRSTPSRARRSPSSSRTPIPRAFSTVSAK
jgi:membrane dipeptidase